MLGLQGETYIKIGFLIPRIVITLFRSFAVAVAVSAITNTVVGKRLLNSPRRSNMERNISPCS